MNVTYVKTVFATRQKLLKEEEDKCSELTAQIEAAEAGVSEAEAVINEFAGLRSKRKGIFADLLKMGNPQTPKRPKSLIQRLPPSEKRQTAPLMCWKYKKNCWKACLVIAANI